MANSKNTPKKKAAPRAAAKKAPAKKAPAKKATAKKTPAKKAPAKKPATNDATFNANINTFREMSQSWVAEKAGENHKRKMEQSFCPPSGVKTEKKRSLFSRIFKR